MINKILQPIIKNYRRIINLAILLLIGWTASFLVNLYYKTADNSYQESQSAAITKDQIKFNQKTLKSLDNLSRPAGKIDITNVGRGDPFSPY